MLCGCAASSEGDNTVINGENTLYQVSTLDALMQGVYDGEITLEDLRLHGDFGIGTFDALDGEMVVLDGTVYQVLSTGEVITPDETMTTPFAMVTSFDADIEDEEIDITNIKELQSVLDTLLPSQNDFYAIKIHGTFSYVETRSVPAQEEPYPLLADVTAEQAVFQYENVSGTLAGYWCPSYIDGVNLAGYHLHFLSDDLKMGGHLLDCSLDNAYIAIDTIYEFQMLLPQNEHFAQTDLSGTTTEEKQAVEQ
jgi:acetolactate decarboxylase